MIQKKIAIFPIQSKTLEKEDIFFVKTLSLFIHLSLDSLLYTNSTIIRLVSANGEVIPEEMYLEYTINELLDIYNDNTVNYLLFINTSKNKSNYIITYNIYENNTQNLLNSKHYILSENLFEKTYKLMIFDILKNIGSEIYIDNYLVSFSIFKEVKNIIENDDNFFSNVNNLKYIEELNTIYSKYNDLSIFKYIIRKLLSTNNIFLTNKIINDLKLKEKNNGYALLLLATTLIEFKQYTEALNILNSIEKESIFFKLKEGIISTIIAETYLKLNDLKNARTHIMKSIKFRSTIQETDELFLEIMFKSKYFLAFKSFLDLDFKESTIVNSPKASYWIARYYSEISINNNIALSYLENFKYNSDIIFLYLKILYRISYENNNNDKLRHYITNLYKKNILNTKEDNNNNLEYVKMFVKVFIVLNEKNNLKNLFIKDKIEIIPFSEINFSFENIEKNIFNQIYYNIDLEPSVIRILLFFILNDYNIANKELKNSTRKDLYFYTKSLINKKNRLKLLKKSYKFKKNLSVLNKIIIYYCENKNHIRMSIFLKKRKKYVLNDEFSMFYTIKNCMLKKKYKKALEIIENIENLNDDFIILKSEIYFNLKEYEKMINILKKYKNDIVGDNHLSYIYGIALSKIKNNREGLFYLQNSYNLNPNKKLQKELIKEYKRYGIDYLKE
jgi:hypothetical protein